MQSRHKSQALTDTAHTQRTPTTHKAEIYQQHQQSTLDGRDMHVDAYHHSSTAGLTETQAP
jgi:hypothetical protein